MLDAVAAPQGRSLSESLTVLFTVLAVVVAVPAAFANYAMVDPATAKEAYATVVTILNGILPVLVAACLMPFRGLFPLGAALLAGFGPLAALHTGGGIESIVRGKNDLELGFGLSLIAGMLLLCAAGTAITALAGRGDLRSDRRRAVLWGLAGSALAIVQLIGLWLPWSRKTVEWTKDGDRISSTKECCTLFTEDSLLSPSVLTVVSAILAAMVLVLALCLVSRPSAVGLIIGVGCFYLVDVQSSAAGWLLVHSGQEELRSLMGLSPAKFAEYQPNVEYSLLPGMWISAVGVVLIFLSAPARMLARGGAEPGHHVAPAVQLYGIERPYPGTPPTQAEYRQMPAEPGSSGHL